MSKERELLVRARDVLRGLKETHYDLYWDIQTALDQPEQEPVAWSDEEIKALYDRHAFAMESDEYMWGFRDAEKAHGITGGEE